jgi:hypothetical protein
MRELGLIMTHDEEIRLSPDPGGPDPGPAEPATPAIPEIDPSNTPQEIPANDPGPAPPDGRPIDTLG